MSRDFAGNQIRTGQFCAIPERYTRNETTFRFGLVVFVSEEFVTVVVEGPGYRVASRSPDKVIILLDGSVPSQTREQLRSLAKMVPPPSSGIMVE